MYERKGASELSPKTLQSMFSWGVPRTSLPQSVLRAPLFVFALRPRNPLGGPGNGEYSMQSAVMLITAL